jgi:hypothetical protein
VCPLYVYYYHAEISIKIMQLYPSNLLEYSTKGGVAQAYTHFTHYKYAQFLSSNIPQPIATYHQVSRAMQLRYQINMDITA